MLSLKIFKDKISWLIFSAFLIIILLGALNHAPWRDEAQSWLIVRDLDFSEMISQMPYEGTPPLWHLLLFPLAKLGLPYASEFILHYLIAAASIFLLIFYSPLPRWIKFAAPFSYYFLFEYSVIARNYNLSILLLFIIATLYEKRWQKPVLYSSMIFLLSWSNIHSLIPAALLGGFFIFEFTKKVINENWSKLQTKHLVSASLVVFGPISAVLMLIPYPDQLSGYAFYSWPAITNALSVALLPQLAGTLAPSHYLFLIISLLWIPLTVLLIKNRQALLFFSLACAWLFFIFITKHFGDLRHYGLILVFLLFAWWLSLIIKTAAPLKNPKATRYAELLILAVLISQALYSANFYYQNVKKDFSGAKEIADYIKENNLDNKQIATYPSYSGSALLPYLPEQKFYQFETGRQDTFLTWDVFFYTGQASSYLLLKNKMKINYQQQGIDITETLFLTTMPPGYDPDLELITKNTRPTVKADEFFYLYRWLK